MSEEVKKTGITTQADIEPHPAYIETEPTKKPKASVTKGVNKQREVKIGSSG